MAGLAIFDLDGTLIDTNLMTARAFRELAGRHGLPVPPARVVRDAIGLHDLAFFRAIYPGAEAAKLAALSVEVERREGEIGRELGDRILFPGVAAMLARLRGAGLTLCLASTGSRTHVCDMLACAGIGDHFTEIRCDAPDKARMTGELLARHGKDGAAFVGDTRLDVAAARANGIPVYGAGYGYVKPGERDSFDRVADSPDALAAWLLGEREGLAEGV